MTGKMKPSGVAWIGDIPEGWEMSRVKYHYEISLGKMLQPLPLALTDTLEYYMCSANITWNGISLTPLKQMWFNASEKAQYKLRKGDLLVTEGGDVAVSCIWNGEVEDCYLQNAAHRVRQIGAADNRFLYYWLFLCKHTGYIDQICNKATIAHFTKEKFGEIPLCVMRISEQKAIADFLDVQCAKIDSVIADIEEQIETLQKYKKSLITETVTKGCTAESKTKTVRLDFADEINEAWIETRVKYLCSMYSGDNLTSSDIEPEGDYPVYGGNGLRGFYAAYTNDGEHVLIGRQGALCGNVHLVSGKFWATDHAVVTYPYEGTCNGYLFYLFSAMNLNQYSQTAAQPGLAVAAIQNLSTCIPPTTEIQQEIAKYLDEKCGKIDSIIEEKRKQLEIMEEHKKSLIYEYVTGKKRVTEVN